MYPRHAAPMVAFISISISCFMHRARCTAKRRRRCESIRVSHENTANVMFNVLDNRTGSAVIRKMQWANNGTWCVRIPNRLMDLVVDLSKWRYRIIEIRNHNLQLLCLFACNEYHFRRIYAAIIATHRTPAQPRIHKFPVHRTINSRSNNRNGTMKLIFLSFFFFFILPINRWNDA